MVNILIVDDDRDFADSLADLLEIQGYSYSIAHDGRSAIELSKRRKFDIAFVDVKMPGIDGVETLHLLRQAQERLKIVIVTGYATSDQLDEAIAAGAFTVLEKPCPVEQMLAIAASADCDQVVLIADDDSDFTDVLDETLSTPGRKVRIANNGSDALQMLERDRFSILLLDMRMPDLDGYEILKSLVRQGLTLPVIVLTAYPYLDEDLRPFEASIKAVLAKPVAPRRLIEAVTRYGLGGIEERGWS